MDPKLANLVLEEAGKEANGLLFGASFVKDLGQYVGTFTTIEKAQNSMRKVFSNQVSTRAGRTRGHLSSRTSSDSSGHLTAPSLKHPSRAPGMPQPFSLL